MLINMEEMLKVADKNQFAVGEFTVSCSGRRGRSAECAGHCTGSTR